MRRTVDVDIIGAINDFKLKANVTGYIEDTTGSGELEFKYKEVPPAPGWHPLNYTDPLVLLPGAPGVNGGVNFANLSPPGSFRADVTLDFDNGLRLRKGATITVDDGGLHTGGYYMLGTARSGHIDDKLGAKYGPNYNYVYREFMHPAGPGQVIGIGYARWPRLRQAGQEVGEPIEAVVSSRYRFNPTKTLPGHYVRIVEVTEATWDSHAKVAKAKFNTRVEPL